MVQYLATGVQWSEEKPPPWFAGNNSQQTNLIFVSDQETGFDD